MLLLDPFDRRSSVFGMSASISTPNLDLTQLKLQARELRDAHRAGDTTAHILVLAAENGKADFIGLLIQRLR